MTVKTVKKDMQSEQFLKRVADIAIDQAENTRMLAISLITITAYVICVVIRVFNGDVANNYNDYDC